MINLRYHIVSITAVFLALGIGLTLGSSFLDRVTVDNLKDRLDAVQERVDRSEAESDLLGDRVDDLEDRDRALAAELPERMLQGRLTAVPVVVIAAEGTDQELVDTTVAALASAGADVGGSWWLTERWLLDGDDEVDDLSDLLGLTTRDPVRLRRNAAIRIADLLNRASSVARPADATAEEPPAEAPVNDEPALLVALREAGFIDHRAGPASPDGRVLLPEAGARYVVVSGTEGENGAEQFAAGLLEGLVADGPAAVLAAQGSVDLPAEVDAAPPTEDARRTTFVGPVRDGEFTGDRVSTLDNLDTAAGLTALILAVEDLGDLRTGHYGVAAGASRLLPGVAPAT